MAQEVRSSQSGTATFDFSSQAGVMKILHAIRHSDSPLSVKNELRDLVFAFANTGGDQATRNILEEQLQANGIQLGDAPTVNAASVNESPSTPTVHHGFASARPTPQKFSTQLTQSKDESSKSAPKSSSPNVAPVAPITPRINVSTPTPPTPPTPTTSNAPDNGAEMAAPDPVASTTASPATAASPVAAPTSATPSPSPTPTAAQSAPVANLGNDANLARIKQIKGDVNKTFGNPVNLVDIDNTVGREYMSALLEAMKILPSGSPIAVKEAMERLETVYAQVTKIPAPDSVATTAAPTPAADSVAPQVAPAQKIPIRQPSAAPTTQSVPETPTPTPTPAVAPVSAQPTTTPTASSEPPEPPAPPAPPVAQASAPAQAAPAATGWATATPTPQSESVPSAMTPQHDVETKPKNPQPAPSVPVSPASASAVQSPRPVAASVAEATPLRSPSELPDPREVANASVDGNPLYTPHIDAGLQQLLEEWPLFNKSGLFGTGPKGREHPLFKKLADLQIPLILAGRFEGATPAIKQSVTDYMNGWRYEQGLLYEKGETFEQYLRRVIKHIIDLQEAKTRS